MTLPLPPSESSAKSPYDRVFWLTYVANALTMIAIAMLFRYADFVVHLGGAEGRLGMIVGVGMVGSLLMRVAQGVGIDQYGPRRIWLASQMALAVSLILHLWIQSVSGPPIFVLRICMQTSIAGIFGASITYISRTVPAARVPEIIGTLGSSGFIGILLGPIISDWILRGAIISRESLDLLFLSSAALVLLAWLCACAATWHAETPANHKRGRSLAMLWQYRPAALMMVAVAIGAAMCVHNSFLKAYAQQLRIPQIAGFFTAYAITAFVVRLLTRRQFARTSRTPWIVVGLSSLSVSVLLHTWVSSAAGLILPGIAAGTAHALLFPAVVGGGSTAFPESHRGLGTTLMLSMFDIGGLIGAPLIGGYLQISGQLGLPSYPTMFVGVAAVLMMVCAVYLLAADARRASAAWASIPKPLRIPARLWKSAPRGRTAKVTTSASSEGFSQQDVDYPSTRPR